MVRVLIGLAGLATFLSLPVCIQAQEIYQARTQRISNAKIEGKVSLAGRGIKFAAYEGELVRFHLEDGSLRIGLAPVIVDGEAVRFKVFDLSLDHVRGDGTILESMAHRETFEVPLGGRVTLKSTPLTLALTAIRAPGGDA